MFAFILFSAMLGGASLITGGCAWLIHSMYPGDWTLLTIVSVCTWFYLVLGSIYFGSKYMSDSWMPMVLQLFFLPSALLFFPAMFAAMHWEQWSVRRHNAKMRASRR